MTLNFFTQLWQNYYFYANEEDLTSKTAIAFLCTCVQSSIEDDKAKLARVIKYFRNTKELVLKLRANTVFTIKWWINATFAVHKDMRSHTGGTMSMGSGVFYGTSQKKS